MMFHFAGDLFYIKCDGMKPQLCTNDTLDREETDAYEVRVQATSTEKPGCFFATTTDIYTNAGKLSLMGFLPGFQN